MRWLLVSSSHQPTQGGIGAAVTRFVKAAACEEWDVHLITRPGKHHPPGATVHEITTEDDRPEFAPRVAQLRELERIRPYRYALWSRAVARKLREIEPDFDAVEFVDSRAEGYVALTSSRVRDHWHGVPMIVFAHTPMFVEESVNGEDPARFGRPIYHDWERMALAHADGVLTTSRLLLEHLPHIARSCVVGFPIDLEPIRRAVPSDQIALIGSVQPRKGVETWVRSLNLVFKRLTKTRAVLVGPDTSTAPGGSSMVEHLKSRLDDRYAKRLQCRGPLPHVAVQSVVRESAVVVVPSRFESFSLVAAEAIACGCPVIVSDGVGIGDHVSGLRTVPVDDVVALADAQIEVLSDPVDACRHAVSLRSQLAEVCSPARHLAQRVEFIRSLPPAESTSSERVDTLERIDDFIAHVEADEREMDLRSEQSAD